MDKAFDKLAAAETEFFNSSFLAPVIRGQPISVRIAGVVVSLQPRWPAGTGNGWGVFQPTSYKTARFVRFATLQERAAYLELFPSLYLILCRNESGNWFGIPAGKADTRFQIAGLALVRLLEEVRVFDTVKARFDGRNCLFDSLDPRQDLRAANYLREALQGLLEPSKLTLAGLRQEARDAYLMAYGPALAADLEARRDKNEDRLKGAIERAGASYQSYIERGNTFTVEYRVGNETHRSVVKKDTLEVESAGICLSGGDRNFDLQSLVTVIREGQRRHRIVRVGNNYGNHDYGPEDDQDEW